MTRLAAVHLALGEFKFCGVWAGRGWIFVVAGAVFAVVAGAPAAGVAAEPSAVGVADDVIPVVPGF